MFASIVVIASAFLTIALTIYFAVPRTRWGRRPVRPRVLLRALLPWRIVRSASGRLDIAAMLFSLLLASTAIGWALCSSARFALLTHAALAKLFVEPSPTALPDWICSAATTLLLYLAYEFAYWLNHYLSHRVRLLWAFHKVHHTAESLSSLTNFRVHPVDTVVFYNMAAAMMGMTGATLDFVFGRNSDPVAIGGTNLLILVSSIMLTQLQHSHLWISLPGRWGRVVMSPAHHQLHHSIDPRHHNSNFGSTTALWDRLFGTLYMPARQRERLSFGVDGLDYDPHSARGAVLMPFVEVACHAGDCLRNAARFVAAPADRRAGVPAV